MDFKDLLKTGVFGVMTNGFRFVIVNDHLIYENGEYDNVKSSGDYYYYKIAKLVNCLSFSELKRIIDSDCREDIIYDKDAPSIVETPKAIETAELCEGILMDDFPQITINGNVKNLNITINNFKEEN